MNVLREKNGKLRSQLEKENATLAMKGYGRIKPSSKSRQRNRAKAELDKAAALAVFERDGYECQRCHTKGRAVQWCHVIGRRHLCTRWEPDNALTLCAGCHMFWHGYPSLSGPWFAKTWPERHEHITALYNEGGKINPVSLRAELRGGSL